AAALDRVLDAPQLVAEEGGGGVDVVDGEGEAVEVSGLVEVLLTGLRRTDQLEHHFARSEERLLHAVAGVAYASNVEPALLQRRDRAGRVQRHEHDVIDLDRAVGMSARHGRSSRAE